MRLANGLLVVVLIAALAGCGDDADDDRGPGGGGPPPPGEQVSLDVRVDDGEGEVREASLRCEAGAAEATGYLDRREPAELCRSAVALRELLTEEPPREQVCTQIFGGPHTARFTGTLAGEEVDRRFSRQNGCRIAEWDRMQEAGLLPAP